MTILPVIQVFGHRKKLKVPQEAYKIVSRRNGMSKDTQTKIRWQLHKLVKTFQFWNWQNFFLSFIPECTGWIYTGVEGYSQSILHQKKIWFCRKDLKVSPPKSATESLSPTTPISSVCGFLHLGVKREGSYLCALWYHDSECHTRRLSLSCDWDEILSPDL